jgi:hypothetical protein
MVRYVSETGPLLQEVNAIARIKKRVGLIIRFTIFI